MRVIVLTKEATDYAREVDTFMADFERQTGRTLERMDPESPDGVSFTGAYDILELPSLVALSDDGHVQYVWTGRPLPTINEVSYYV